MLNLSNNKKYEKKSYKVISSRNRDSSMKKSHTLTINIKKSKPKHTHFIYVYALTTLPQHKKVIYGCVSFER